MIEQPIVKKVASEKKVAKASIAGNRKMSQFFHSFFPPDSQGLFPHKFAVPHHAGTSKDYSISAETGHFSHDLE